MDALPIGVHSWRQADTAAIARNFHENGYRFSMPQVDWGGAAPGFVESEFPIYPYTVAILYHLFGVHVALGRLLSVLSFILAASALYALVRATVDQTTALWSTAFFLFLPLNVFYSRTFMPEAWMLAASIFGVLFFYRWTERGRTWDLFLSAVFVALAALIKLPALYLGLPLLYLAWLRFRRRLFAQKELWIYALGVVIPVAMWYWHAHEILRDGGLTFGIWEYGSDKWGNWTLVASPQFWNGIILRSLAERWLTWVGFPLLLFGLTLPRRSSTEGLFDFWLIAILIYFVIVARGNFVHEYYQFPFMPAGVVFVGKVFARYWQPSRAAFQRGLLILALAGIAVLAAWRYADYLRREDPLRSPEIIVGAAVRSSTKPGSLLVTVAGGNPTLLYLSHRKGWSVHARDLTAPLLDRTRLEGASYLAGTGKLLAEDQAVWKSGLMDSSRFVFHDAHGYILQLNKPKNSPDVR